MDELVLLMIKMTTEGHTTLPFTISLRNSAKFEYSLAPYATPYGAIRVWGTCVKVGGVVNV